MQILVTTRIWHVVCGLRWKASNRFCNLRQFLLLIVLSVSSLEVQLILRPESLWRWIAELLLALFGAPISL